MLSSTFARRLNPSQIFIPLISPSFASKSISAYSNPQPNPQNFDPCIVSQTLSSYKNDWKSALDFFNWVETEHQFQHTTDTYNRMIDILGKFFEFDRSWGLIEKMAQSQSSIPNHTTFRVLFKRYAAARLIREAASAYDRLDAFNLKDDTSYCNLIDALCEHKHVLDAKELCFREKLEARNVMTARNRTKICNIILRGWFKMGWWRKCREFWEEMDENGVHKSVYSYSIYMDILCKSGKPWKTVKLYKELRRAGVELDVVAYNTVVRAIGLAEGVDSAIRVYKEIGDLGCMPNVVTYNSIIKLLCQNQRVGEAYEVLEEMRKRDVEPNLMTYHCFFGCLVKKHEIVLMFSRMIDSGIQPRLETFVMLMRKFGEWGFFEEVVLIWGKMKEHGVSPDEHAYNALIDALIKDGKLDLARKYEEEMLAKGLSARPRKELRTDVLEETVL